MHGTIRHQILFLVFLFDQLAARKPTFFLGLACIVFVVDIILVDLMCVLTMFNQQNLIV
jgi:hypothetical protein